MNRARAGRVFKCRREGIQMSGSDSEEVVNEGTESAAPSQGASRICSTQSGSMHWNRCQQHRTGMHQSFRQWTSTAHSINQSINQPTSQHQCTIVERSMPGTIQSGRTSSHADDTETEHRLTTATETMHNDSADKLVDVIWAA